MQQLDLTFTNLSQLSRAYGAPAVDLAERVLQRDAIGALIGGGGSGVIGAVALVLSYTFLRAAGKEVKKDILDQSFSILFGGAFGGIILGVIGVVVGVTGFSKLIDTWAWTALFDPHLALAHQIFGSMGAGAP